jgi:sulfite exporter TauE/SafE/copper chaperone CopZ
MNQDAHSPVTHDIAITGMTCSHCAVFVERIVGAMPGIRSVRVNERAARARVISDGPLNLAAIDLALSQEGYGAKELDPQEAARRPDYGSAAAAVAAVLAVVLAAKHFQLLPRGLTVTDNMSLGFVFAIGLAASVSSCMAVTGGLLVALAAKYNEATAGQSAWQRFIPHLYFNAGRLISYTVLGALIGAAGSALALSPTVTSVLTIAVSAVMILTGLQMLGFLPRLASIVPGIPRRAVHRIHDLVTSKSRGAAFTLGAATFFLPCGFTLALQLYVLAKGSAALGAATMFVFALGTLPALLSLSALSSLAKDKMQRVFLRLAGAALLVLGVFNVQYGLVQGGSGYAPAPQAASAQTARTAQIVDMKIDGFEYVPHRFTVKAGVPVEWRIDAREAEGCGRVLIMRKAGVMQLLSSETTTVIQFTPPAPGEYAFNCSMGMMTPGSGFTVTN